MNRSHVVAAAALAALLSLAGLVAFGSPAGITRAQDTSMAGHPLVGAWLIDSELDSDTNTPETMVISSDGTVIDVQSDETAIGVWEPTGPTTAILNFSLYFGDEEDVYGGGYTVRATVQVSDDGASFTAEYTLELINPDGTTSGQAGPGQVTAVRIVAEAPGTPEVSIEDLFASFEGEPEATPTS